MLQQSQKEIVKLRDGEEKQRRAREAREKAEVERAARAARKRALVDMNAHETQEGVMDSLMEALQTGSAFSRPDQRRKRQTRVAGGKFKPVRAIRAPTKIIKWSPSARLRIIDDTLSLANIRNSKESIAIRESTSGIKDILDDVVFTPIEPTTVRFKKAPIIYRTPEENHSELENFLLAEAKKTPKRDSYLSRVSTFQRKNRKRRGRSLNPISYFASPIFAKTPKRDVSIKVRNNLNVMPQESLSSVDTYHSAASNLSTVSLDTVLLSPNRILEPLKKSEISKDTTKSTSMGAIPDFKSNVSNYLNLNQSHESVITEFNKRRQSPRKTPNSDLKRSLYRETLMGKARRKTPVNDLLVIVGKHYKRNSIVRRAVINRKNNSHKRHMTCKINGKLSNHSASLPNMNWSLRDTIVHNSPSVTDKYAKIYNQDHPDTVSRTINVENFAQADNENQNDIVLERSSAATGTFADDSPVQRSQFMNSFNLIHSPKAEEINGVHEIESKSPTRILKSLDKVQFPKRSPTMPNILDISDTPETIISPTTPEAREPPDTPINSLGERKVQIGGKKSWKFWQKTDTRNKIVTLKYNKLEMSDNDVSITMRNLNDVTMSPILPNNT